MVTLKDNDELTIVIKMTGGAETLTSVQQALILAMEQIGSHKELAGSKEFGPAMHYLGEVLKGCLLDISQNGVGLGGRPFRAADKV